MHPLRRHQLAYVSPAGWRRILAQERAPDLLAGLRHWASEDLPLVVTRQRVPPAEAPASSVALGLCLPERWQRRRLALELPWHEITRFAEFPTLANVLASDLLRQRAGDALARCDQQLHALGRVAHVYGSAGWQQLTGLGYLHPRSDLDLWISVPDDTAADAVAAVLATTSPTPPEPLAAPDALNVLDGPGAHAAPAPASAMRLDGELVFPDGTAVAWREWQQWRSGQCSGLLVKRLDGVALVDAMP